VTSRVWLIPVQPSPAHLRVTIGVLATHDIDHLLVGSDQLRALLDEENPFVAVIHGGVLSPLLMDVQRWLAAAAVPTLILVEGISDEVESVLLNRGAYDVVSLPAPPRKLGSRLEAMARNLRGVPTGSRLPAQVNVADVIEVVPGRRTARVGQAEVGLTKSEFDLLLALALRHPDVLTRDELAEMLGRPRTTARALESHISRLRAKLRRAGAPDLLESVRGVGYRLHA
jgi:DNA-binding response OmpR family regulator